VWEGSTAKLVTAVLLMTVIIGLFTYLHFRMRNLAAARIVKQIEKRFPIGVERERIRQAFIHNTSPWHSIFRKTPVGWTSRGRNRLKQVITEANQYVQRLNDAFTDPSGSATPDETASPPLAVVAPIKPQDSEETSEQPPGDDQGRLT
jgi:hypothetical protein